MSVVINGIAIPDSELMYMRNMYQKRYEDYRNRLEILIEEGEQLKSIMKALGLEWHPPFSNEEINYNEIDDNRLRLIEAAIDFHLKVIGGDTYSEKMSWLPKCRHVLNIVDIPLTTNEIIEVLIRYFEPTLDRQKAVNSIPATLSVAWKEGKIDRKQNENGEFVYYV